MIFWKIKVTNYFVYGQTLFTNVFTYFSFYIFLEESKLLADEDYTEEGYGPVAIRKAQLIDSVKVQKAEQEMLFYPSSAPSKGIHLFFHYSLTWMILYLTLKFIDSVVISCFLFCFVFKYFYSVIKL